MHDQEALPFLRRTHGQVDFEKTIIFALAMASFATISGSTNRDNELRTATRVCAPVCGTAGGLNPEQTERRATAISVDHMGLQFLKESPNLTLPDQQPNIFGSKN